jgi:hypothetical protein
VSPSDIPAPAYHRALTRLVAGLAASPRARATDDTGNATVARVDNDSGALLTSPARSVRHGLLLRRRPMNIRVFLLIGLTTSACQDLPFGTRHPAPRRGDGGSFDGAPGGGSGNPGVAGADGDRGVAPFPGFEALDAKASTSNSVGGVAVDADGGAFSIPVPWAFDAGVVDGALPFTFPPPSSLPPANMASPDLALASDSRTETVVDGCGEPPACYLRMIIATARGRVYSARMSGSYPKDSCVTKAIDCDGVVLIGDPNSRYGDALCSAGSPQITLGFLVPQGLFFSWRVGQVWESTSGFRSEWTLIDAGDDSGAYEPMPGQTSKLWPAWARFLADGEIYGELLVPLRHSVKHTLAIGFALFDIRVRQ